MQYFTSPFPLPAQRIVGLLSCQIEPLVRSLDTRVVTCQVADKAAPSKETNQSKKAAKNKKVEEEEWEIELEDTILFPEGGGQPWDLGTLRTEEQVIPIQRVVRKGLKAVHLASTPLTPGSSVTVELDWSRRLDLMQQHCGQHLMSGILEEVYKIPTLGWSLQPAPQPSYVELPRAPTPQEMQGAIDLCNQLIREDCPVTVDVTLEGEQARPTQIPADYQGGVLRHVTIHHEKIAADRNPCCGTHPPSLSHLQALHILPQTTPIRGTNVRLYFIVGQRVLQNLATSMESTRLTALAHGCHQADAASRTELAVSSLREGQKREKKLREELSGYLAGDLIQQAKENGGKAILVRDDEELEALTAISNKLKDSAPAEYTFVLASNVSTGSCPILITGQDTAEVAEKLKKAFEGKLRGGGKGRWQGKLEGKLNKKEVEALKAAVYQE